MTNVNASGEPSDARGFRDAGVLSERQIRRRNVRAITGPHWLQLAGLAFASFVGGFVEAGFLVTATQTALAVAQDDNQVDLAEIWPVTIPTALALAGALVMARAAISMYGVWAAARLGQIVGNRIRIRMANAFLRSSWETQQAEPSGRLQQLVAGFALSAVGVVRAISLTVTSSLSLAALIIAALFINFPATGGILVVLLVLGSVLAPLRRKIKSRTQESAVVSLQLGTGLSELGALGLEMQTYGVRPEFGEKIEALITADAEAMRRSEVLRSAIAPVYTSLGYVALLAGLGLAATVGSSELSGLGAVMLVMLRSLSYGQALQTSSSNLLSALPFLEILNETLERYETDCARDGDQHLPEIGAIDVSGVSFRYPSGEDVLHNISFRVERGEHIGIVGPSGSGKSTLVQLLLGLRSPTAGKILIDDVDLETVSRSTWNSRVAFVSQDAQLFSGSIADNIAFFRDGIERSQVVRAAQDAQLLDEIEAMPRSFDSDVGERGSQLSGGQRQRVSIARALAGRPDLLILDEPTSALDVKSEVAIRQMLSELRGQVTVIVIAHRLSTLEMCDRVMVVLEGELQAIDSPADLAEHSDFYRGALALSKIQ